MSCNVPNFPMLLFCSVVFLSFCLSLTLYSYIMCYPMSYHVPYLPLMPFCPFLLLIPMSCHVPYLPLLLFCPVAYQSYYFQYSSGRKSWIFSFAQLLLQILVNYQNHGQFWSLLVLRIPKLSLKVKFDKDLAEIIKVKDNWSVSKKCLILDLVFDHD